MITLKTLFLVGALDVMNIVKGVADLLRRSSGGQAGENSSWGQGDWFSAPTTRIHFGYVYVELHCVVNVLYEKCLRITFQGDLVTVST